MITSRIIGSTGQQLKVNGEGEIGVVVHTHPPIRESRISLPFRGYFENSGSNDMIASGSLSAPVEYSIEADAEFDYYIKSLSVKLADATAKFNEFGALSALTNGVEFYWQSIKLGKLTIHDGIKDNIEWFRLSNTPITTASIIDLSGGGADAIVVQIDLAQLFGNPWGIRLKKDTTDKLTFSVRDNLAGLDEFNIIGYGTKV
jgi:hypothetical protein